MCSVVHEIHSKRVAQHEIEKEGGSVDDPRPSQPAAQPRGQRPSTGLMVTLLPVSLDIQLLVLSLKC